MVREESNSGTTEEYRYLTLLPHEFDILKSVMIELFEEINFKEAIQDPNAIMNVMKKECYQSPYSMVYACFDQLYKPLGYTWFRLDTDNFKTNYCKIEQIAIAKEYKNKFNDIAINLIKFIIHMKKRWRGKYTKIEASTPKLTDRWRKLGFKGVEVVMRFDGSAEDFEKRNKVFNVNNNSEVENNGKQVEEQNQAVA